MRHRFLTAIVVGTIATGGIAVSAATAGAATVDRGTTQLLTCDDVSARYSIKDTTKHGIDLTVRSLKAAGFKHEENFVAGDPNAGLAKREPDPANTPDLGDTDSCTGPLTSNFNNWNGNPNPYGPNQQFPAAGVTSVNEIVKIAGSMTGRGTCDTGSTDPSIYALHGKLIVAFGQQASVGTPGTPAALDTLGKKVQSQVYVRGTTVAPYQDLVDYSGIGIKGVGEGAWFDARVSQRGPASTLAQAAESCFSGTDTTGDGIIGEPPLGGIVTVTLDTDADTNLFGGALNCGGGDAAECAARNNSMDWSI